MNPSTQAAVVGLVGASFYGIRRLIYRKAGDDDESGGEGGAAPTEAVEDATPWSRSLVGQSACATVAGWFQVYSGGIMIDTVATRLQVGYSPAQSLWGVSLARTNAKAMMRRYSARAGVSMFEARRQMLLRSNLCAGHFVTMLARFPYLFLNFNAYAQTEQYLLRRNGGGGGGGGGAQRRHKTFTEELICVSSATLLSSAAITAAECPKILDQLKSGQCTLHKGRETMWGVASKHGVRRLFQGYTACFMREGLFNTALLGSPSVAQRLRTDIVLAEPNSGMARALDGRELVAASLLLGLPLGFITNAPDQLKTIIQSGSALNMRQALRQQAVSKGGLSAMFGRAALYRASYIAHAVVAFNFARDKVEGALDGYGG